MGLEAEKKDGSFAMATVSMVFEGVDDPDPAAFVRIKRAMAISPHRDPLKRNRDAAQAGIVQDWLDRQLLISSETDQPSANG